MKHLPQGSMRWYKTGRSALHQALKHVGIGSASTVLMPAYIAAGVIDPVKALGSTVRFYATGKDLLIDESVLIQELDKPPYPQALFVLHPMGRTQSIQRIAAECQKRKIYLIEDCAQGLFSRTPQGQPLGMLGDAALFSFPKALGVEEGALLVCHHPLFKTLPEPPTSSTLSARFWYRKHLQANRHLHLSTHTWSDSLWLSLSGFFHERYYAKIQNDFTPRALAFDTKSQLNCIDADSFAQARRRNVSYLYTHLQTSKLEWVYPHDATGWVPMAVPAFVTEQRHILQTRAMHRGLFLATLIQRWDHIPAGPDASYKNEKYYIDHHVLLPIHEHLSLRDMEHMTQVLNGL